MVLHILQGFFDSIVTILISLFTRQTHTYNAEFAKRYKYLSMFNKGFCLNGVRSLTRKRSYQNVLVAGSTGSGKTSCIIISSIFSLARRRSSMVIHDAALGEVYQR